MKKRIYPMSCAALAVAAILLVAPASDAARVKIGGKMPQFKLQDTSGKEHTLDAYKGKVVVLDFSSQHCPWSRGADPDIAALAIKYKDKGVVFLGIDSHNSTSVEDIAAHMKEANIPYPILKDKENTYADAVGAERTPELFVVNKEGNLVYHGAFDNRRAPDKKGDVNYLTDALDAVVAGEAVANPEVAAWGCGIKRVQK